MPIAGPAGPETASPSWAAGGGAIIAFLIRSDPALDAPDV
jgi:hypothetical protein